MAPSSGADALVPHMLLEPPVADTNTTLLMVHAEDKSLATVWVTALRALGGLEYNKTTFEYDEVADAVIVSSVSWEPVLVVFLVAFGLLCLQISIEVIAGVRTFLIDGKSTATAEAELVAKEKPSTSGTQVEATEDNTALWEKVVFIFTALCVSVIGELYYGLGVPFMPAEAAARGIDPDYVGFMISCYALGMLVMLPFAANMLRVFSPFQLLNFSILVQACTALAQGAIDPLTGSWFFALVIFSRLLLGAACAISETVRVAVVLRLVSKQHVSTIMSLTMGVRSVSTLVSPAIGGALYKYGGYTFPYLLGGIVFIILYFAQLLLMRSMRCLPKAVPQSSSMLTVLKVPMVWCMVVVIIVWGFSSYLFEPIYGRILGGAPYNMPIETVGLYAAILPCSLTVTFFTLGTFLNALIGELPQQALGMITSIGGFIILLFSNSSEVFAAGMATIGVGIGLTGPTNPSFVLRILEQDAGLSKREVGGALGAVLFTILMLGALVGPVLGSLLYNAIGFNSLCLSVAITFGAVYLPCAILLIPYDSKPRGALLGDVIRSLFGGKGRAVD